MGERTKMGVNGTNIMPLKHYNYSTIFHDENNIAIEHTRDSNTSPDTKLYHNDHPISIHGNTSTSAIASSG